MSLLVDIEKRLGDFQLTARFETQGGVLGLLGASGCGKSMTLKCIAGIETPDRGRVVLDGETLFDSEKKIDLPPQKRKVGYLFQSYALFPNMTVRQNILCGLRGERDEAYHMCQKIAVMDEGRLLAVKDTKTLFADPGSVCACTLTGCKNVAPARKTGEYAVEVPDWGIRLQTAQPVGDGVKAVGIRAHYFNAKTAQNRYPIEYLGEMEEPFEWIVEFRYRSQSPSTPPLWWRVPKDRRPVEFPAEFGVAPVNVLLLYE